VPAKGSSEGRCRDTVVGLRSGRCPAGLSRASSASMSTVMVRKRPVVSDCAGEMSANSSGSIRRARPCRWSTARPRYFGGPGGDGVGGCGQTPRLFCCCCRRRRTAPSMRNTVAFVRARSRPCSIGEKSCGGSLPATSSGRRRSIFAVTTVSPGRRRTRFHPARAGVKNPVRMNVFSGRSMPGCRHSTKSCWWAGP
jgi:hypothetical protein